MIEFTENYSDAGLRNLGLVIEDLIILQRLLTDSEFRRVHGIEDNVERVNKIVNILNNRKELPEKYRGLVTVWKGFEGIYVEEEMLF